MKKIIIILIIFVSCNNKHDDTNEAEKFYLKTKKFESELDILYNTSIEIRKHGNNKTYQFFPIQFELNDTTEISIPSIKNIVSEEEIEKLPLYENIEKYIEIVNRNYSDSLNYNKVKNQLIEITNLIEKLNLYRYQSTERLGRFIIFYISKKDKNGIG